LKSCGTWEKKKKGKNEILKLVFHLLERPKKKGGGEACFPPAVGIRYGEKRGGALALLHSKGKLTKKKGKRAGNFPPKGLRTKESRKRGGEKKGASVAV